MSQAKPESTSRRTIIQGAAVLVGSIAPVPALATTSPDAELLRLGVAFDELKRQYDEAHIRWRPHREFVEREIEKLRGKGPCPDSVFAAIWRRADMQFPTAKPRTDDILELMDKPQRQIMALQPKTLAGLVVKAKVAQFGCESYWDAEWKDRDWDHMAATQLIEAVLAMAGGQSHG